MSPAPRKPPRRTDAHASDALFEHAPDACFVLDGDGRILKLSRAAERLTGFDHAALAGQTFASAGLLSRAHLARAARVLAACALGDAPTSCTFPLRRSDGGRIVAEFRCSRIPTREGMTILAIARDVTERSVTEERLKAQAARYQLFAAAAPEGICITEDGRVRDTNAQMLGILGCSLAELIGAPVLDFVAAPSRPCVADNMRSGVDTPYVHLALRKDGAEVPVEVHGKAARYRGKSVRVTTVRDVSDRMLAEQQLRETAERLQVLFEFAPDAIWLLELDGTAVDGNRATEELIGIPRAELAGRRFFETGIISADQGALTARLLTQSAQGLPTGPDLFRLTRRDGTAVAVQVRTYPVRMKDRQLVLGIAHDVSERLRAEESLRALIAHATHGIYRSTIDGRFLSVNPAMVAMLGYDSAEELLEVDIGRDIYAKPMQREQLMQQFRDAQQTPGLELAWRRKDGRRITVRVNGRPVHGASGAVEGFEAFVEDVTDRRELEAQLRQAQKMEAVGQLTGGIAHDFNNLLSVIGLNAELARESLGNADGSPAACLQEIESAVATATAMTRQLLGFSRRAELAIVPTDLAKTVRGLAPMLRRVLPKSIVVHTEASENVGMARADATAVEQILLNLVTNARDAMPEGGHLTITVSSCDATAKQHAAHPWIQPGRFVRVTVRDTGVGMTAETRERLCEPFYTTKPLGSGTGLGMAMVYGLVKQHNGFLDVESELDMGTSIHLHFPLVHAPPPNPRRRESGAVVRGTETILLVEDDDSLRRAASMAIERNGYTVITARDGREGLAAWRANTARIDLVISDLMMPGMGGAELLAALRESGRGPRFIFVSGYDEGDAVRTAAEKQSVPFLQKPWKMNDLLRCIRSSLDGAGSHGRRADAGETR